MTLKFKQTEAFSYSEYVLNFSKYISNIKQNIYDIKIILRGEDTSSWDLLPLSAMLKYV